jgi:hypothetical protein
VGDGLGASDGCVNGRYPPVHEAEAFRTCSYIAEVSSSGDQFAGPKSTAAQYSNAIDFDRASLRSNAQIHAQTRLIDRHAPSSQRGGSGVRSPLASPQVLGRNGATHDRRARYVVTGAQDSRRDPTQLIDLYGGCSQMCNRDGAG